MNLDEQINHISYINWLVTGNLKYVAYLYAIILILISCIGNVKSSNSEISYQAIWYVKFEVNDAIADTGDMTRYTHYFGMLNFFNQEEYNKFYPSDIPNEDYLFLIKRTSLDTSETQIVKSKDDKEINYNFQQFIPYMNLISAKGFSVMQHIKQENCVIYFKSNYYFKKSLAIERYQSLLSQNSQKYYWAVNISSNFNSDLKAAYSTPTCNHKYGILTCRKNTMTKFIFSLDSTLLSFIFTDFSLSENDFVNIEENLIDPNVTVDCDQVTASFCKDNSANSASRAYFLIPKGFKENCVVFNARDLTQLAYCGIFEKPDIESVDIYNAKPDYFFLSNCVRNNRAYILLVNTIPSSN